MPGKLKFVVYQGATFRKKFTYKTLSGPVNIEGALITFEIAPSDLSAKKIYTTNSGHIIINNALGGIFTIRLSPDVTSSYTWQSARYNLTIQYPNGDITRLLEGGISVSRRV